MLRFLLSKEIKNIIEQPLKLTINLLILIFVVFNIYIFSLIKDSISLNSNIVNFILILLPVSYIIFNDFIASYNFNVLLLPRHFPVSDSKNSILSLLIDFFRFPYLISATIAISLNFLLGHQTTLYISLLFILNFAITKFYIHYIIQIFAKKNVFFALISFSLLLTEYLFLKDTLILFIAATTIHLLVYINTFKYFRDDYFSLLIRLPQVKYNIYIHYFYGYLKFKNLLLYYIILKISIISVFIYLKYYLHYEMLSPIIFFVLISPVFLFSYFNNNIIMLNFKTLKLLFLSRSSFSVIIYLSKIILLGVVIDFLITVPIFVFFGIKYIISYLIMIVGFYFIAFFISLYLPKSNSHSNLLSTSNTAQVGTLLDFLIIGLVAFPANNYIICIILFIMFVSFIACCYSIKNRFQVLSGKFVNK